MGKLRILSGSEVCRILEGRGFTEVRRRGSHIVMWRKQEGTTVTVPVPNYAEIKTRILLSIIRQGGVPQAELEQ